MTSMDEVPEFDQHQISSQSWTIIVVGWSVTVVAFIAFFIAIS